MDGSRLAKTRVSCLKIEPKVSIFPVIEANLASITCATTGNFSSSLFLYLVSVSHVRCVENNLNEASKIKKGKPLVTTESLSCSLFFYFYWRWFSRSVRTTKTSQLAFLMTYSDTEPINNRSTALRPVAPIIIKSI